MKTFLAGASIAIALLAGSASAATHPPFILTGPLRFPISHDSFARYELVDMFGDGFADIVAVRANSGDVHVYPASVDGRSFGSGFVYSPGVIAGDLTVEDLDGDARPDVVVSDRAQPRVGILHHQGFEYLSQWPPLSMAAGSLLATGDLNGDGRADIVSSGCIGGCALSTALNFSVGFPSFVVHTEPLSAKLWPGAVGDVDGDGRADLVGLSCDYGSVGTPDECEISLAVGHSNGDGTFAAPTTTAAGLTATTAALPVAVADVNGDGKLDVLIGAGNGDIATMLSRGGGAFTRVPGGIAKTQVLELATADLNRDGEVDVIANYNGVPGSWESGLEVLLGKGDGNFDAGRDLDLSGYGIAVGDVDHNGALDVGIAGGPAQIALNETGYCVVPSLRSRTLASARAVLTARGCALGHIRKVRHRIVRRARIIGQQPSAGSIEKLWRRVDVTVSLGAPKAQR